jgi:hypothetical protein
MDGSVMTDRLKGDGDLCRQALLPVPGAGKHPTRWTLHVRAVGRTWNIPGESSGIDPRCVDRILLAELARRLELAPGALDDHAVDRSEKLLMVRPWATWG